MKKLYFIKFNYRIRRRFLGWGKWDIESCTYAVDLETMPFEIWDQLNIGIKEFCVQYIHTRLDRIANTSYGVDIFIEKITPLA